MVKSEDSSTPVIPMLAENASRSPYIGMMVNITSSQILVQKTPDKLLDFAESNDRRQFEFYTKMEQARHQRRLARETTTRMGIGAVLGVIGVAFGYAITTGDARLAEKIVTTVVGGFGGVGIGVVLAPKKNDD